MKRRYTLVTQIRLEAEVLELRVMLAGDGFKDESVAAPSSVPAVASAVINDEARPWHKLTFDFEGPVTSETATVNPFTDCRLDVSFRHSASGETFVVPGYYAADGDVASTSATSGSVWRTDCAPNETGAWTYTASFRTGSIVAVADTLLAGASAGFFDGETGNL
ncbi:DUF5060 domain-containing protein [Botrimarina hoheduenensis]|uniref:DUF5060 domain-containing protein n=1 Tax=Botrimarina hoheduenensis TaxID=2528000 RepID=A0A5C5VZD0_9BACT|nr:DUF5060 domain-containing protein [Botrimarina hoheduenensis]TWT43121.1 hypothetical protein Pla111_20710 [Botrimarina hoheduenensis]